MNDPRSNHDGDPNPSAGGPRPGVRRDAERLEELLAERAVQGLEAEGHEELRTLMTSARVDENDGLERAAAALHVALAGTEVPRAGEGMPTALRAKLSQMGQEWAAKQRGEAAPAPRLVGGGELPSRTAARPAGSRVLTLGVTWGGWMVAAASLALVANILPRSNPNTAPGGGTMASRPDLSPNERLLALEHRADTGDEIVAIDAAGASTGVEAELRLDPQTREGYLAIAGLDVSDKSDKQYQVWVLDAGRDHPVDGGTFDIRGVQEGAKVIVPVNPRLPLRNPVGFAVSEEPRGGVVVPRADHILVRAALPLMGPDPAIAEDRPLAP
ncbi:MAG: hypothetical protein AB7K52_00180 [Phycisphaerales bacterium]